MVRRGTVTRLVVLQFIKNLVFLNGLMLSKAKAITTYDQALALHVAKDFNAAFPLMKQAAELGSQEGMSLLGSMYLLGQGVTEDGALAVQWLQKAVDSGYDGAVSVLGMAYATGKAGVRVDIPKARDMLAACAEKGDEQSANMLAMMDAGEGMFKSLKNRGARKK